MTMLDVLRMCPSTGNSDEFGAFNEDTPEYRIDRELLEVIKDATPEMKGFYCGIYAAYVTATTSGVAWETIWFLIKAATEWDIEDINLYSKGT